MVCFLESSMEKPESLPLGMNAFKKKKKKRKKPSVEHQQEAVEHERFIPKKKRKEVASSPGVSTALNQSQNLAQKNKEDNDSTFKKPDNILDYAINKKILFQERKALPIYPVRVEIVNAVIQNDCSILIGETASGKTTQIPQFLYRAGLSKSGMIAITQPRRVAAITVAERVSMEMGVALGDLVGYSVRFDDTTMKETKIKYLTDGMLLREALSDPLLKKYSVIILDEAHERTIHTDILFGIVKLAQKKRRKCMFPLKVLVMSATMDVDHFSQYFNNAPVYYLEGRQHPVQIMYTLKEHEDYTFASLVTVFQIHQNEPPGDILVFCTGQEEIESMVKATKETSNLLPPDAPRIIPHSLYAALPSNLQLKVFKAAPQGCRKVIFSTNIAETSVTIPGIKFVIDTGMVKARTFQASTGLDVLKPQRISKAQAWQRAGRAGRESSGICYRLYTKAQYEAMRDHSIPEIQRCNLSSVILQMLAMGITDVMDFDFMDKPSNDNIVNALVQLHQLGAVEKKELFQLTALGRSMAAFPLEPRYSKIILSSKDMNCSEEVLTVISLLSWDSVLYSSVNHREHARDVWKKFHSNEGDHITQLKVYRAFKSARGNKHWCKENFVNSKNMRMVIEIRKQLADLCRQKSLPLKSCGQDMSLLRKCLCTGLFTNVAEHQKDGSYLTVQNHKKVHIHPTSCLFKASPSYVVFTEMVHTTKSYIRNLSVVDPEWLMEIAPEYFKKKRLISSSS